MTKRSRLLNLEKPFAATMLALALSGLAVTSQAWAKLPAPSPEAQAKKDRAAATTAFDDKVSAYQLCMAQDRLAAAYRKSRSDGGTATPDVPACQDPGTYAATQEATKVGIADALPLNKEPVKK